MDADIIATIANSIPNFAGFLIGYVILTRIIMQQHATINRCIDALVSRANCDDDHLAEVMARRRIADPSDT